LGFINYKGVRNPEFQEIGRIKAALLKPPFNLRYVLDLWADCRTYAPWPRSKLVPDPVLDTILNRGPVSEWSVRLEALGVSSMILPG
jgi:hypothetical protein